ncbi:MAG TPA: FliH/SctL family protein [Burkholderiaceae bacterium]
MTSSKSTLHARMAEREADRMAPVPPRGAPQARFIPREELEAFAAWRPGSFGGGGAPSPHPSERPENKVHAAPPPPPPPPTEEEWLEEVRHAREAGYQDGYRDGQVALEAFKEQFAKQMAAQFGQMLQTLDAQWNGLEEKMALAVTRTAVQLARQVVRHELDTRPEIVAKVAQEAVGAIVLSARHLCVRVHPADHAHVAEGAGEALKARDARLVADPAIEPGGCVVDSDLGHVDARIATRWAQAAAVFGSQDGWDGDAAADGEAR